MALVIVHLSSLDAYTNAFGEAAGARLAHAFYEKIRDFDGPVFIIDQNWIRGEGSGPRSALYRSLIPVSLGKDIDIQHFDEGGVEWSTFLEEFVEKLKSAGVNEVILGGLWYDRDRETGAVVEAYNKISDTIASSIDEGIVAYIPGKGRI